MKIKEVLIVLGILIVIGLLAVYWFLPGTSFEFTEQESHFNTSDFSLNENGLEEMQFYSNMRYTDEKISYKIENCHVKRKDDMKRALQIVEEKTILEFYPVNSNPEISITCEDNQRNYNKAYFVAGEGGPVNITKAGDFNVIFHGKVLLLKDSKCSKPNVAIHELMHALGFDHSANPGNIMYNVSDCDQIIGNDIPKTIEELYSLPSQPDLVFQNISSKTHNRYLDLNLSIRNHGFADSSTGTIKIYADDSLVKEVDLKALGVGQGLKILLENIILKKISVDEIKIEINSPDKELSKSNNLAILN